MYKKKSQPTKGLMAIVLVANITEKLCSCDVGENVQHPDKQFAVDAAGRGDYGREERHGDGQGQGR